MSTTSSTTWSTAYTDQHSSPGSFSTWGTDPVGSYSTWSTDPSTTDMLNTTGKVAFYRINYFISNRNYFVFINLQELLIDNFFASSFKSVIP